MFRALIAAALRYKLLAIMGFLVVAGLGVRAWQRLPIDAFPDVTPVQVNVFTESPGLAAEDVEQLLSLPVESALAGLPNVQDIRSISLFGLSNVVVNFTEDTNIYFARRLVAERLQEVIGRIPEGYGKPQLGPNTSGLGQVFWYTVERADGAADNAGSAMELRTLQDWSVRLHLRTAPGVDDVLSWGGQERQYQIVIDPRTLVKYGLSFKSVVDAVSANNRQVGGQYIDVGREQFLVRGLGLVKDEADLGRIVLKAENGTPVYIRDVSRIEQAGALRFGAVTRDGKEVVFGMVLARVGENAKSVVDAVKAKLETVKQSLPGNVIINTIYERTGIAEKAVATAVRALVEGSILVAIVLFLFLGELRSALVVIAALPMAMLIAFIGMERLGMSANLMSLAGLAIGIGMMVDGAVVMVENSFRTMAEGLSTGEPLDRTAAVLTAASKVAQPITFAILIIIVVFLPLFTLQGLEGKLFKPMAISISLAMAGSLILTLILIPVLTVLVLRPKTERDTLLMRMVKRGYLPLLEWVLAHKRPVAVISGTLVIASLAIFPFLGREFMPTLQEQDIILRIKSIPSASLQESIAVSERVASSLRSFPEVRDSLAMIGRAERGETEDVSSMEVLVRLRSEESKTNYRDLAERFTTRLSADIPEVAVSATQPIQSRVEELISGVRAPLAAKIYGDDLATLDRLTAEIKEVIGQTPGAADLSLEANAGKPQIRIAVDRERLARYGLNANDILDMVRMGIGQEPVSTLIRGVRRYDVVVRLDDASRANPAALSAITLRTPNGATIPLSEVATIETSEGYSFIRRERLQRYAVIQMDVEGRDVGSFVEDATTRIRQRVALPSGYRLEWGGAFENQQRALARLAVIVPVTILFIFVLLYTAFDSAGDAGIVLANVPFAAVGGLLALAITGQYVSVPSAIGFIAVLGVAMLNGIVLVSFFNELRAEGMPIAKAVRQGALLRLRPVLMTASVAILGLLPMLLSSGVGAETQRPLATVVIGGLFTSTVLTLLLLPAVYEWVKARPNNGQALGSSPTAVVPGAASRVSA